MDAVGHVVRVREVAVGYLPEAGELGRDAHRPAAGRRYVGRVADFWRMWRFWKRPASVLGRFPPRYTCMRSLKSLMCAPMASAPATSELCVVCVEQTPDLKEELALVRPVFSRD